MRKTDIWLMGLAALFTASKSENNPIALDRFINMVPLTPPHPNTHNTSHLHSLLCHSHSKTFAISF